MYLHQKTVRAMITLYQINCQNVNTFSPFSVPSFIFLFDIKITTHTNQKMSQATSHCLKYISFLFYGGREKMNLNLFSLTNKRE